MRHFFTLDGTSSTDFNTWIANSNMFDGAEHDDDSIEIPGRNGTIVLSNNRYKNFNGTVSCYIPHHMRHYVDALRSFLSARHQYCRYEDTMHPEVFLKARFKGGFSLSDSDRVGAAFDLVFDCKPQKFLKSGELPIEFTATGIIYNPTDYAAKPLIRCHGTSGTVTVGGVSVAVTGATSYVDIDCELMEVYEGSTSRNNTTTLTNGEFPEIAPGEAAVSFTGFSSVEITPNWYMI